jgi:GNAT superfamily N-acetyltransferase
MQDKSDNVVYRQCGEREFDSVYFIINEAAVAYRGLIPAEFLNDPYMSRQEFRSEIGAGVEFWGYEEDDALRAVMGIQRVEDVVLIRHAYTRTEYQGRGIGGGLLNFLMTKTQRPVLVGTWAGAGRAIEFYQHNDFALVPDAVKDALLRKYWQVPDAQIEDSVVLANVAVEKLSY